MSNYHRPPSFSDRRGSSTCDDLSLHTSTANPVKAAQARMPRGPPTPSMTTPAAEYEPSAEQTLSRSPPPPPTPAASPGPVHSLPDWGAAGFTDELFSAKIRQHFKACSSTERTRLLADLLNMCTSQQLSFVHQFVSPLLKKDPFTSLPDELCLRILSFIDDPKVLARAAQVSRRWHGLLSDDVTWRNMCLKHDYARRFPDFPDASGHPRSLDEQSAPLSRDAAVPSHASMAPETNTMSNMSNMSADLSADMSADLVQTTLAEELGQRWSYKAHFKQRYLVDAAWRSGGRNTAKSITADGGVVTNLHLTSKYIIVALDNAFIYVFDTEGENQKTLQGHVMGVWAMVPWGDTLVSGGCDRDVRVWNLVTGECVHTLRGHSSTVRCLKMADENTAISGSRDTTLRIWDIRTGVCKNVLTGHQASVRCLEIKGNIVVSGSYDTTAKVWNIADGRCLHTLQGHYSQIYAIAFDGNRIATGSLDTSVRIWNAATGECQAVLQGHTSLVGQLQMRGDTLVTGGSDGSVRVWSLSRFCPIHRLAAHDNSVTSLQFDDTRVVSGGSDGRVKVWDLKTGQLVRELVSYGEAVWRVAFEDEKCVAMALRSGRTVMEVWDFSPPDDTSAVRPSHSRLGASADLSSPTRPMSAMVIDSPRLPAAAAQVTGRLDSPVPDVQMGDAAPGAPGAPGATLLQGNSTFTQDA